MQPLRRSLVLPDKQASLSFLYALFLGLWKLCVYYFLFVSETTVIYPKVGTHKI